MNKILKRNTSGEEDPRYNVGGFKIVPNMIGVVNILETTKPENALKEITELLKEYNSKKTKKIEDIIDFHFRFERIHPFGDQDEHLRQKMAYFQNSHISSGMF